MKDILAAANAEVLAHAAHSNVLVALDYDGTLAPIVDDPKDARMRESTRTLLSRVCDLYPTIVISGRGQADALRRLRGTGVIEVIGNHGLEPWRRTEEYAARVQSWVPLLEERLASFDGLAIEDKVFSVAVHYRRCSPRQAARSAILETAEQLEGARVLGGKLVVNLVPEGAPHKGTALTAAQQRLGCTAAIYVGDDDTDEDVFGLADAAHLLAVRVERDERSRAPYFLRNQDAIDSLLDALAALRVRREPPAREH